jgi:putative protease
MTASPHSCAAGRVELLAPAGNFEKLRTAVHYGADAVYLGGHRFSLRRFSGNFSMDELARAVTYAHDAGVRVYVACNVYARAADLTLLEQYLTELTALSPDALIVADPGVVRLARRVAPSLPLHLSTQANTTNAAAAQFWADQGIRRINAARELTLEEIRRLTAIEGLEIEAFVHGAMCIAYSGRCLLSHYLAGREANRGACCHPCRWQYAVVERTRPGRYLPVVEDQRGSYVFNSRDLCMIDHLPALIGTGVAALKIEGRMKGIHYLATTVKVYREAMDACRRNPAAFRVTERWHKALAGINHRGYATGFYMGRPEDAHPDTLGRTSTPGRHLMGQIVADLGGGWYRVSVRNKTSVGASVTVIPAEGPPVTERLEAIEDALGRKRSVAQPGGEVNCRLTGLHRVLDIVTTSDDASTG